MKKTILILVGCVLGWPVFGQTRNYFLAENCTTNVLLLAGSAGVMLIPPENSVKLYDCVTNSYSWPIIYALQDSVSGAYRVQISSFTSLYPSNSVSFSIAPNASGYSTYICNLANLDGRGFGFLDVNYAELSEYSYDFLYGIEVGSALAAVLLGYRYTKKALGWVDGGND
jgi:hypothetical protein